MSTTSQPSSNRLDIEQRSPAPSPPSVSPIAAPSVASTTTTVSASTPSEVQQLQPTTSAIGMYQKRNKKRNKKRIKTLMEHIFYGFIVFYIKFNKK